MANDIRTVVEHLTYNPRIWIIPYYRKTFIVQATGLLFAKTLKIMKYLLIALNPNLNWQVQQFRKLFFNYCHLNLKRLGPVL